MGHPLPQSNEKSLLDDPLRNGVYFAQLVQKLNNTKISYVRTPENILQCRHNFELALNTLPQVEADIESLMVGGQEFDFILEALYRG